MSTRVKTITVLALGVIGSAAARYARSRTWNGQATPTVSETAPQERSRTRRELYEEAKRLDVHGRSRMCKAELQKALHKRTAETALV